MKDTRPQSLENQEFSDASENELSSINYPINRAKFGKLLEELTKRKYFRNPS